MSNRRNGFAVGEGGAIVHTTDGGETWRPQSTSIPNDLYSVATCDSLTAVACGAWGTIIRTSDGGASWRAAGNVVSTKLLAVTFSSMRKLVAVGEFGVVLTSTDQGLHWLVKSTPATGSLTTVSFADSTAGVIGGANHLLMTTLDGGTSWTVKSLNEAYSVCQAACVGGTFLSLAVKVQPSTGGRIITSTDFGNSWSAPVTDAPGAADTTAGLAFLTPQDGFASFGSSLYHIENGSISESHSSGRGYRIFGAAARDGVVMLSGTAGIILRYYINAAGTPAAYLKTPGQDTVLTLLQTQGFSIVSSWDNPRGNAVQFCVQIASDSLFGSDTKEAYTGTGATSGYVGGVGRGRLWYCRVLGFNDFGSLEWSIVRRFTTTPVPPGHNPGRISPAKDDPAVILDYDDWSRVAGEFRWQPPSPYVEPDGYPERPNFILQVGTDSSFLHPMFDQFVSDSVAIVPGLQPNATYYWRIRSDFLYADYPWLPSWRFTTGATLVQHPPLVLTWPLPDDPLLLYDLAHTVQTVHLGWETYPPRVRSDGSVEYPTYQYQFGLDSSWLAQYQWPFTADSFGADINPLPFKTYYWRARAVYSFGKSNWTAFRPFTIHFNPATLFQVQHVDSICLLGADRDQPARPPDCSRSPLEAKYLSAVVRCVVPAGELNNGNPVMVAADTGAESRPWHSVIMQIAPDWLFSQLNMSSDEYNNFGTAFGQVQRGDCFRVDGMASEDAYGNTILLAVAIKPLPSVRTSYQCPLVHVSDFGRGRISGLRKMYSTGEPLEGSFVELRNLTVHSIASSGPGTLNLIDGNDNMIRTSDLSAWFKMGAGRDPLSTYAPPQPGAHISSIKGVIFTGSNGQYDIAPISSTDMVLAPDGGRRIVGSLFVDMNRNGIRDGGDLPYPVQNVLLRGRAERTATVDSSGHYEIPGLDTGSYMVVPPRPTAGFYYTVLGSDSISVALNASPQTLDVSVGYYREWNRITGHIFQDWNENGIQDAGENGVGGVRVQLYGPYPGTAITDSAGQYILPYADIGWNYIMPILPPGWEKIYPRPWDTSIVHAYGLGETFEGVDFACEKVPPRVKLNLTVDDNVQTHTQVLAWGVRGGASFGIYGPDSYATNTDFAEHEIELPPRSYPIEFYFFDARFQDPRENGDIFGATGRFGEGGWTDMRNFSSRMQRDTFLVVFVPGYREGGDYPMTIQWDKEQIAQAYEGPVIVTDPVGNVTDMLATDRLVITDRSIGKVRIIAANPVLPPAAAERWNIVSVPHDSLTDIPDVFTGARSSAYAFDTSGVYFASTQLRAGKGYWLKTVMARTRPMTPRPGTVDSIQVVPGWNLIGAPSEPTPIDAIHSNPPGVIVSAFSYGWSYVPVDTLRPYGGCWIKASASGKIFFNGAGGQALAKSDCPEAFAGPRCLLDFEDANGRLQTLEVVHPVKGGAANHLDQFELPPAPPAGSPDVRFASGRYLEVMKSQMGGNVDNFRVTVAGIAYPLTIRYRTNDSSGAGVFRVAVISGDKKMPLPHQGCINIPAEPEDGRLLFQIESLIGESGMLPLQYALEQNFPNPFNPSTVIRYALPQPSRVQLKVYDVLGREVAALADETQDAGFHTAHWNAGNEASGVYFIEMHATAVGNASKQFQSVRKMILVR